MDPHQNLHFSCAQTKKFLKAAKPIAHSTTVVRDMHQRLGMLFNAIVEERNVRLACQEGCSFCCHLRVDAFAHEVLYAADFIRRTMSAAQIEGIVARSKAHTQKVLPMSLAQRMSSNNPCPLLMDGRCSAYGGRPTACRNHHATDVKTCEHFFESCDPDAHSSVDRPLYDNARAVWLGMAKAFAEEGYDGQIYDFGSAIGEALENPVTARRWRDRKRAFSSQALAKEQPTAETFAKDGPSDQRLS